MPKHFESTKNKVTQLIHMEQVNVMK